MVCADPVQDIAVKSFKYHPGFIEHRSDLTDDIGIVKMMKAANFRQNNIKPICLPFRRELQQIPAKLLAIGWGRTGNSKAGSAILQKASLPLYNLEGCRLLGMDEAFSEKPSFEAC